MDCRTARHLLEFARLRSLELETSEAEALESHLADCPECGPLARTGRQVDDRIGRAMRAVPVPDGLRDRLVGGLKRDRQVAHRKLLVRVAAAAAIVLAIGFGASWYLNQACRFPLESLVAFRPLEPEELDAWFRARGYEDVVVPREFDYKLLHHFGVSVLEDRKVSHLLFVQGGESAHVYILSSKQFDLDHLEQQGMAAGSHGTVKLIRPRENRQIAYLVIYTGASLEPFLIRNLSATT